MTEYASPRARPMTDAEHAARAEARRARPGGELWERATERGRIRAQIAEELDRQTLEDLLRDRDTPPASRWRRVLDALFR